MLRLRDLEPDGAAPVAETRHADDHGPECDVPVPRGARRAETNHDDDIRGEPQGHFVVLSGYRRETREMLIADPSQRTTRSCVRGTMP